ncbi:sperm-associated antigen 1-like [Babylonia areolata]|uniref:sperm-associated antigen 1-like n=1 Tax=Babylonia areolata TaxID=304850 RepID=UPI003FD30EBC
MTQDYYKAETTKRYDIPLAHLDYAYIRDCSDVKELEKILKVLRSGDEGHYPELENAAEKRLEALCPKSRVLRKENPALRASDLDKPEQEHLKSELETWKSDMENKENVLGTSAVSKRVGAEEIAFEDDDSLPPVRSGKVISTDGKVKEPEPVGGASKKKVLPRSYKEWDKFDVDKELGKTDEDKASKEKTPQVSTFKPDGITSKIDTKGMSDEEKKAKAIREKDKGNEAFYAHDYEESIVYYTRSISISPLAATHNNRALAYLRLSEWNKAIDDCNYVLAQEKQNIKALLRRGTAYKGQKDYVRARADLDVVLSLESNNKTAQNLLKEIGTLESKAKKEAEERKPKGRRMVIEEVDGSEEEEEEEEDVEEIVVEKPDSERKPTAVVNGYSENAKAAVSSENAKAPVSSENAKAAVSSENVKAPVSSENAKAAVSSENVKAPVSSENAKAAVSSENAKVPASTENAKVPSSAESEPMHQTDKVLPAKPAPDATDDTMPEVPKDPSACKGPTITTTSKDIWEEDEVRSAPTPELNSASQKPKPTLVATNILSGEAGVAPSGIANASDVSAQNTVASGDADQAKMTPTGAGDSSTLGAGGETGESPTPEMSGEAEEKEEEEESDEAAEPEPEHARPVFVQKAFPAAEAALREKGNNLFRAGQYAEGIEVYGKVIDKLEKVADQTVNLSLMYNNRAACYLKIGDCQASIRDCNKSLDLVPHSVKPLLRRAAAYEAMERYGHAYIDYKHILRVSPSVEQALQGSSRCQNYLTNQHGHGQWRSKLPPHTHVSHWDVPVIVDENAAAPPLPPSKKPGSPVETPAPLSEKPGPSQEAPSKTKDTPAAQPQEAAKEVPKPPSLEEEFETIKAQGNKHVQKGEYEAAVKCYCHCVTLFVNRAAIFTNRALCYLKLNKAKEADEDCTIALALEPNNCKAFYRRALAKKAQKLYKDSLQDLLQLLRLEPNNSAAKKEMEVVKGLYKEEYDQLKSQPPAADKKKAPESEKKRKRMKIEEVDDTSDTEDNKPQPLSASKSTKPSGAAARSSPSSTPSHAAAKPTTSPPPTQPSPATDSNNKHTTTTATATARTPESRKPGRGKSKKGGSVKETSLGLPLTPPSTPKLQGKITPFEFLQHWNSLKQAKEIQPYVQLLEQISPDDLPGVISNKLDGHMLHIIARCAAHDAQTGEVERAYGILHNIRQVPRFSTVVMFLSSKDKQDIRKVLESSSVLGSHSAEEVAAVRKDYGLK